MFVDKKELKEWKRMMERQLAEKASELKESFLSFYRADFFFFFTIDRVIFMEGQLSYARVMQFSEYTKRLHGKIQPLRARQ